MVNKVWLALLEANLVVVLDFVVVDVVVLVNVFVYVNVNVVIVVLFVVTDHIISTCGQ